MVEEKRLAAVRAQLAYGEAILDGEAGSAPGAYFDVYRRAVHSNRKRLSNRHWRWPRPRYQRPDGAGCRCRSLPNPRAICSATCHNLDRTSRLASKEAEYGYFSRRGASGGISAKLSAGGRHGEALVPLFDGSVGSPATRLGCVPLAWAPWRRSPRPPHRSGSTRAGGVTSSASPSGSGDNQIGHKHRATARTTEPPSVVRLRSRNDGSNSLAPPPSIGTHCCSVLSSKSMEF